MNTAYIGFLGGFVALLLAAGSAQAQFGPPNPDVDRDGKASFAEYRSVFVTQTLKRLDADKDGRVSRAEYQKAIDLMSRFAGPKIAARAAQRWALDDANQDGYLSEPEMTAGAKRRFDRADTDHDGWLSKAEILSMQQVGRGGAGG